MKTTYTFLMAVALFFCACTPDKVAEMSRENFKDGAAQYKYMMKQLPDGVFPQTFENGEFKTSGSGWWCSGFYPGSLIYLYEQTKDDSLLTETKRILEILKKEQYNTTTHDLGFMMYCSFGNMLSIDPKPEYKEILLNSAKSLSSRFSEKTGCIKSWDSRPEDYLVIIDNMMNLELLFWATQETGDSTYYDIAVTHANTTMENHFRSDYSSYHVLNYDSQTGKVKEKRTAQGYADSSAWARGQSWGLYGYTVVYRFTHDEKYLEQAKHIAEFILNHPNLPEDKIPYWDYDAPNIPNTKRDASAGAVMGSAFLELAKYVDQESADKYKATAKTIIETLSSPEYKAEIGTNGGFVLKHSVGHFDQGTEVDVPLTYADYYFFEAMKRYLEW
ncbi:glycoside hydrolase family 88 protein [Fulvivirga maritima]|uniref:glycoside hydrolase family 88 protein n=1 Tax=Fulvivirga maritima TaxID=2904247 RepID=UPI001F3CE637|nr:glycoside hydrolase family 88 protein [Fulvivirga maritima]UII25535.1 glycoside hydrolase family 88 protein [Fulvivirga maritima]